MVTFLPAFLLILTIPVWLYFFLKSKHLNPAYPGWVLVIICIAAIYFLVQASPLALMLLYITSVFWLLKLVVAGNRLSKEQQLNYKQWLLFSYTWFGMNPLPFSLFPGKTIADFRYYFKKGFSRIIIGIISINILVFLQQYASPPMLPLFNICYLVSLSLILHFGVLNIATGSLRWLGVPVSSLFKDPAKSTSLQEFWSKRWNIAFVELTTIAVLRPLRNKFGQTFAFWVSYIFSGLLHEMAISLPVNAGYGMPCLYFLIQAFLILTIEKYFIKHIQLRYIKRLWVLVALLLPVFFLFHQSFINGIVYPLIAYFNWFAALY